MNTPSPSEDRTSMDVKREVDALCDRFEAAWQGGERPDLSTWVPAEAPLRRAALAELVLLDLDYRLRAGEPASAQDYCTRYPELRDDPGTLQRLVAAELRLRGQRPASAPAMSLEPQARLGPYEILGKLGQGGMGEVYRARDTRLERDVAIKVIAEGLTQDPQAVARFQREARAVAAVSHPNIRAIFDVGTEGGITFAVMEYLEGQTLADRIGQAPIEWRAAVDFALAVAGGLAAAHAKGIIHRDIKPANIFLTCDGGVKVLDFGLARLEARGAVTANPSETTSVVLTQVGTILGSLYYMAPEQVRGRGADARSDLFALGCVLFEMLARRRPFTGETNADVMAAILQDPPPVLSQSGRVRPGELDRIVLRCLEKDPAQRWQSARELAAALRDMSSSTSPGPTQSESSAVTTQYRPLPRTQPPAGASIAVLPFANMSSDPENEYFSDGLAEELIGVLSKVEGLHVAARTSTFAFKGKNEDVRQIGEKLGVRTVLEGSVRKSGQRLRISTKLINAADGFQLWSETYNRQLEEVFAIQDEIAQSIAKALEVILTEKDRRALEQAAAVDIQAYDYYLRGRQLVHQYRRKSLEQARQMFNRAIEIDAGYARAYTGLADCCYFLFLNWDRNPAHLDQAEAASRKALEIDPKLAEAHVSRGLVLSHTGQDEESYREFETAIRLDPKLFEAYYSYARVRFAKGDLPAAARCYEEAGRIRPDDYQPAFLLGDVYRALGRHADAQASWLRGCRLADKQLQLNPDDARALAVGSGAWLMVGDRDRSLEWAGRAIALDPEDPMILYNIACNYALLGQADQAIDGLEKAVKIGYRHKQWLERDSDLDSLRAHPRFQELLRQL